MTKRKLLCLALLLLSSNVFAGNGSGNEPYSTLTVLSVKSVYDGDTFRAYLPNTKIDQRIRVRGVDTPEMKGDCAKEIKAAVKARDFVRAHLKLAKKIVLTNIGKDKYNRVLASVIVDGRDLSETLIEKNLGRKWKGYRESWCEKPEW
jgi:micrococcal nuclease